MEIKGADVAESVDARDLKFSGATEDSDLSCKTQIFGPAETASVPHHLQNADCSIPELRRHLKMLQSTSPFLRHHLSTLEQQLKSWDEEGNRDHLRETIARTVLAIENLRQPA